MHMRTPIRIFVQFEPMDSARLGLLLLSAIRMSSTPPMFRRIVCVAISCYALIVESTQAAANPLPPAKPPRAAELS